MLLLKSRILINLPFLKTYYGTGGDMNVDEVHEVIPICQEKKILFPLEGVVSGHYKKDETQTNKILAQLKLGVPLIVKNNNLSPDTNRQYSVGDLITGYGVAEAVIHYYKLFKEDVRKKKVIIQGWGNVAGAAAYYLAQEGAIVVGIIDKNGGIINKTGYSFEEIKSLLNTRSSNFLESKELLSFEHINKEIWSIGAEIFIPAAASRLLSQNQLDQLIENKLEVISCGANVPFADKEIFFGPISESADQRVSVIPDFIANCGMARAFSYFMQDNCEIKDIAIFEAVSKTIKSALKKVYEKNNTRNNISKTALEIALKELV